MHELDDDGPLLVEIGRLEEDDVDTRPATRTELVPAAEDAVPKWCGRSHRVSKATARMAVWLRGTRPGETVGVRKPDLRTLIPSVGIAIGLVGVGYGVQSSVTGRDAQHLPDAIESVDPVLNAKQVPRQTQVFVDLVPGYEAELTIDGFVLPTTNIEDVTARDPEPGQQVSLPLTAIFEPGNATITYRPTADGPVKPFASGTHDATVVYWKSAEGRERALSYSWSFTVV